MQNMRPSRERTVYPPDINIGLLQGRAVQDPVHSHKNHDRDFYTFDLAILRQSGVEDIIRVLVDTELLSTTPVQAGKLYTVHGQVRSRNIPSTGPKRQLYVSFLAKTIEEVEGECEYSNSVKVSGRICKPPILRQTMAGIDICDLFIACNRIHQGHADYIPCIAWGDVAKTCSSMFIGETICFKSRIQSRHYTKSLPDGTVIEERDVLELSVRELCDKDE